MPGPTPPTLAEFAAASGMEDFSEDEQIEAYAAAYPAAHGSGVVATVVAGPA